MTCIIQNYGGGAMYTDTTTLAFNRIGTIITKVAYEVL